MLMDEPDSGIDVEALQRIFDALADFKDDGHHGDHDHP